MNVSISSSSNNSAHQLIARYDFLVDYSTIFREENPRNLGDFEFELLQNIGQLITTDFAARVESIFDGLVEVRLERLEQGSVVGTVLLVLAAGISILDFVSKYKDLYESLVLIRQHLSLTMSH
jgi:hypothetical protein